MFNVHVFCPLMFEHLLMVLITLWETWTWNETIPYWNEFLPNWNESIPGWNEFIPGIFTQV